jgi:hypothetical protein
MMSFLFVYIERDRERGGVYKFDLFLLDELLLDIVKVNIYGKSFYFFYFP